VENDEQTRPKKNTKGWMRITYKSKRRKSNLQGLLVHSEETEPTLTFEGWREEEFKRQRRRIDRQ
jgi:hypothetical protein